MDTTALRTAYARFAHAADTALTSENTAPPAGEWNAGQIMAHVCLINAITIATVADVQAGRPTSYDNRIAQDPATINKTLTHSDLPSRIRAQATALRTLADNLDADELTTAVPTLLVSGGKLVVDQPLTIDEVLGGLAANEIPGHARQLLDLLPPERSFTREFWVDATPEAVSRAIARPQDYWTPPGNYSGATIEGSAEHQGDEWIFRDDGIRHARFRVSEIVPGKRTVWDVLDSELSFVDDSTEWNGTRVVFDLAEHEGGTRVRFTHEGLTPTQECYGACSLGWSGVIDDSLQGLLNGMPWTPERAAA